MMARMSCPECGERISPRAEVCPACGCRDPLSLLCGQVARGTQKRDPMPNSWIITAGALGGCAGGSALGFFAGVLLAWPAPPEPLLSGLVIAMYGAALGAGPGAAVGYYLARRSTRPHD